MRNDVLYTCLGCGFKTLKRVFSEDEICGICNHHETSRGMQSPLESPFIYYQSLVNYQEDF